MLNLFVYRVKILLRSPDMIFWTLAFPIVLATLFSIAFANIGNASSVLPVPVAIVDDEGYRAYASFAATIEAVTAAEDSFLAVKLTDLTGARALLDNGGVRAYILVEDGPVLYVRESSIGASIIKTFLDRFLQTDFGIRRITADFPDEVSSVDEILGSMRDYTVSVPLGRQTPNDFLIMYFALLAMACFYGGYFGLYEVTEAQANLSPRAARLNAAPTNKLSSFLASASGSLLIHMACQGIILAYLIVVLRLDFAGRLSLVVLATAVGSVLSHSIGALIGVAVRARENVKEGMVTAVSMLGAVSAGLFIPEVKHLIARHAPWVSRINPFELLTDSYYSLYFYEGLDRYFSNLLGLLIWSVACVLLTYLLIRRRTYDSL